MTIFSFQQFGT